MHLGVYQWRPVYGVRGSVSFDMNTEGSHLADIMNAVRDRILTLGPFFPGLVVEIANPAQFADRADTDPPLVTLFVYRLEPDHTALLATPNSGAAIRMHTLISVTCTPVSYTHLTLPTIYSV